MLGGYIFENKEKFEIKKIKTYGILIGMASIILVFVFGILISKTSNRMVKGGFNYCTIFTVGIIGALFAIVK